MSVILEIKKDKFSYITVENLDIICLTEAWVHAVIHPHGDSIQEYEIDGYWCSFYLYQ